MKIDFYILENASLLQTLLFACHFLDKNQQQQRTYLHTASRTEAEKLDSLLWTFREDSFIPHLIFDPTNTHAEDCLLQIGYPSVEVTEGDLLINLSPALPTNYSNFEQIVEVVGADPKTQHNARERYKYYREQGWKINTQKVKHT